MAKKESMQAAMVAAHGTNEALIRSISDNQRGEFDKSLDAGRGAFGTVRNVADNGINFKALIGVTALLCGVFIGSKISSQFYSLSLISGSQNFIHENTGLESLEASDMILRSTAHMIAGSVIGLLCGMVYEVSKKFIASRTSVKKALSYVYDSVKSKNELAPAVLGYFGAVASVTELVFLGLPGRLGGKMVNGVVTTNWRSPADIGQGLWNGMQLLVGGMVGKIVGDHVVAIENENSYALLYPVQRWIGGLISGVALGTAAGFVCGMFKKDVPQGSKDLSQGYWYGMLRSAGMFTNHGMDMTTPPAKVLGKVLAEKTRSLSSSVYSTVHDAVISSKDSSASDISEHKEGPSQSIKEAYAEEYVQFTRKPSINFFDGDCPEANTRQPIF